MKPRSILKRVVIVLSIFLCAEIGFFIYQINSGTAAYARNLDLGNKYLLSEDYDNAISAFSKAIKIDAMNADAYIGRGDAYKAKGDYVSAWKDYEKAQELSDNQDILREKIGITEITVVSEDGEGVSGAAVELTGSDHFYEFTTDNSGHIAEVIFPEKYSVKVTKDKNKMASGELSAEKGGDIAEPILLKEYIALNTEYVNYLGMRCASIRELFPNGSFEHATGSAPWEWISDESDVSFNFWGGPGNTQADNWYNFSASSPFPKPFDDARCHTVVGRADIVFNGINEQILPDEFIRKLILDGQYSVTGEITYEVVFEVSTYEMYGQQIAANIPVNDSDNLRLNVSINDDGFVDSSSLVWIRKDV